MMAEHTNDDVARLAEMMSDLEGFTWHAAACRLLEQGVTLPPPPPDPAVVVAEALGACLWPQYAGDPFPEDEQDRRLIAAVRDLFTTDALEAAAAKVQEAHRG